MLPTHGLNFLASYTLGHAIDHVSGLNIGGEARPVLPVMQGDEASIERALELEKGDGAVRRAAPVRASASATSCRGCEDKATPRAPPRRRLAGERHLPGADRVPADRESSRCSDIRYMTYRPDVTCDPNDGPKTTAQYFDTTCFTALAAGADRRAPGQRRRATPSAAPGSSAPTCRSSRTSTSPARHRIQVRIEAFNLFEPGALRTAGRARSARQPSAQITTADDGRIIQLGIKYVLLTLAGLGLEAWGRGRARRFDRDEFRRDSAKFVPIGLPPRATATPRTPAADSLATDHWPLATIPSHEPTRLRPPRRGLALGAAASPRLVFGQAPAIVTPDAARPQIRSGVASGDVSESRAIIWSRADRPARMLVDYSTRRTSAMRAASPGQAALPEEGLHVAHRAHGPATGADDSLPRELPRPRRPEDAEPAASG